MLLSEPGSVTAAFPSTPVGVTAAKLLPQWDIIATWLMVASTLCERCIVRCAQRSMPSAWQADDDASVLREGSFGTACLWAAPE